MSIRVRGTKVGFKTFDSDDNIECSICGYSEGDEQFDRDNQYIKEKYGYDSLVKIYDFGSKKYLCEHISHTLCLYRWVLTSKKISCPICRAGCAIEVDLRPLVSNLEMIRKYRKNGLLFKKYYKDSGMKVGEYRSYHRNGRIREVRNYNNRGKIHGELKMWWKNGVPCLNATFKHNKPHNTLREYYNNGNLKMSIRFLYGKKHGCAKYFDTDGELLVSEKYKMDYKYGYRYKYKGKKKVYLAVYKYGVKNGPKWEWYESGRLKTNSYYVNGQINGPFVQYYDNGKIYVMASYEMGKLNDYYVEYYSNGNIRYSVKVRNEKGGTRNIDECLFYYHYSKEGNILYSLNSVKFLDLPPFIKFQLEYYLPLFCKNCKRHLIVNNAILEGNLVILTTICKNCTKSFREGGFCTECELIKATKFNYCKECEEYNCGCDDCIDSICYVCEGCNKCGNYVYGRYCDLCENLSDVCDCDDPVFFPICLSCYNNRVDGTFRKVKVEIINCV